jgi:glycosyltransferase involved in cell wall biosynthesis
MPKVAVCIASYNEAEYLPCLLKSIRAQTFKDYLVYVSYDGSTDDTFSILNKFSSELPLTILPYEAVPGIGRNKNKVVTRALKDSPEYVQMIDGDDFINQHLLQAVADRLNEGDVDWVICWGSLFGDRSGYIHSLIEPLEELMELNRRHSWGTFKAEVLRQHNYDPSIFYAEDWDLWVRLDLAGFKGAIVKRELYYKRWHNSSLMATRGNEGYLKAKQRLHELYGAVNV